MNDRGLRAQVQGVGLLGPGLADWTAGQALLRDPQAWQHAPTAVPAPQRLPATERRRAGALVKAAIAVADQACTGAGVEASRLATVFGLSAAEPSNCHALCEALAGAERLVSPTRFTNSVHNAAGGYWHIAVQGMQPSTSLSAFDASFGAALMEAMAQVAEAAEPVLLVACDVPYPEPLHARRALSDAFGVAMVLAPAGRHGDNARCLSLRLAATDDASPCTHAGLEAIRRGNPAARALPLLQALAAQHRTTVLIEGWPGTALEVEVA